MSIMPGKARRFAMLLRENHAVLLIAAALSLFTTPALFNLPFSIMVLLGLYQTLKSPRRLLDDPTLLALSVCFLCLWLPQLLALPDAVMPARAIKTTATYPRFFFIGVFIILSLRKKDQLAKANLAAFAILSLWVIDALLQFLLGHNLLGYPYEFKGALTGMFHPDQRLGLVLAAFLPFYLECLRRHGQGYRGAWSLAVLFLAVLLLSGKRMAWIMAAVGGLAYGLYLAVYWLQSRCRPRLGAALLPLITTVLCLSIIIWQHPPARGRIDAMLPLFSGDYERMDQASSRRLSVWRVGLAVFKDNPINGIGPRGLRYVYKDYAAADNVHIADGRQGATHPHQFILEVGAETGLIGLAGFAGFWAHLLVTVRKRLGLAADHHFAYLPMSWPVSWLLCAGIAWLPLNAHFAFYGSYWSSLAWLILSIALAQLHRPAGAKAAG